MLQDARDPRANRLLVRDVSARGARVRFVEAGSGPPLLLVHDFLASRLAWDHVLPSLAQHFHVLAPDLPGFGDSEKPAPARYAYGYDAFAESLADLLSALGCGRAAVCGHGIGGSVALTLAASHPDLVSRLILVDPVVYTPPHPLLGPLGSLPLLGPIAFKQLYGRAAFRRHFREFVYASPDGVPRARGARVEDWFEMFNTPAAREAAYATMQALDTRPLVARVPRVTAPTLVAWGRGDRTVPVADGRRLARELRDARFEVFECGHSPPEEAPEAFAGVAITFLSRNDGAAKGV